MAHRRDGYFRTCRTALTERDELAFSRALTERFGTIYCFSSHPCPELDVPMAHTIGGIAGGQVEVCVATGNWQPAVRPSVVLGSFRGYHRRRSPLSFTFERSTWVHGRQDPHWAFDYPYLEAGGLYGYLPHHDPLRDVIETFLADAFRCLATAGRGRARGGGRIWGHDAICDALARGPRGNIDRGFRPKESWSFPEDSPYYRDELWSDDPASIVPLTVRGSMDAPPVMTAEEYNSLHRSLPHTPAKTAARPVKNKLGWGKPRQKY